MTAAHPSDGPGRTVPFSEFYKATTPRLVAFVRLHGAPLPDAADCVQDAMEKAYGRWSTIQHPYSWCRTTVTHEWERRLRRREHPDGAPETSGAPLIRPGFDVEEFEQRHDFLLLIGRLPVRQRQIVALIYDGASPSEIAEIFGSSPEAVRGSLHKARITLRHAQRGGRTT